MKNRNSTCERDEERLDIGQSQKITYQSPLSLQQQRPLLPQSLPFWPQHAPNGTRWNILGESRWEYETNLHLLLPNYEKVNTQTHSCHISGWFFLCSSFSLARCNSLKPCSIGCALIWMRLLIFQANVSDSIVAAYVGAVILIQQQQKTHQQQPSQRRPLLQQPLQLQQQPSFQHAV